MKNGKKPTKKQCILMSQWGLDYRNWLVVKDTPKQMEIVHRLSDKTRRTITKEE